MPVTLEPIIVRQLYTNLSHREFLRDRYRCIHAKDSNDGQETYFKEVVHPLIEKNLHRITLDTTGKNVSFDFEPIFKNRKVLTDFIQTAALKDKRKPRKFDHTFMQIIDAFLQVRAPGFDIGFNNTHSADKVGQILGAYLRDQSGLKDGMQQALNVQKILGIYQYEEVDTHHEESGNTRIAVFLSGDSNDYLKIIDFIFDDATKTGVPDAANANPIIGFCIPGEEFSPLIMRSSSYRTRHLGLLYAPGNLIDMAGGPLDDITYEIFTTNKKQLGSATNEQTDDTNSLFSQALDIHFGPRLKRYLIPVVDIAKKEKITKLVEEYVVDML